MSTLLVTDDGAVRTLTLHRPQRLNAFTAEAYGTFADAIRDADATDRVLAIVLTGAGRGYCRTPIVAAVHGSAVGQARAIATAITEQHRSAVIAAKRLPRALGPI